MTHEINLVGIALSAGLITIIPTFVAFVFGKPDDRYDVADTFFSHMTRFVVMGFLLFYPVLIVTIEAIEQAPDVVGGKELVIWLGTGVLIYWITYVAGTSMRRIWKY